MTPDLFNPPDVMEAHEAWSCSCGPAAFAALLRRPCADVQRYFPGFPRKNWVTPTAMKAALHAAGLGWGQMAGWPSRGLVYLQVVGPWCDPGVPVGAAYRRTHWVATDGGNVFDINNEGLAGKGWLPRAEWEAVTMAAVVASYKRATVWRGRMGLEVTP